MFRAKRKKVAAARASADVRGFVELVKAEIATGDVDRICAFGARHPDECAALRADGAAAREVLELAVGEPDSLVLQALSASFGFTAHELRQHGLVQRALECAVRSGDFLEVLDFASRWEATTAEALASSVSLCELAALGRGRILQTLRYTWRWGEHLPAGVLIAALKNARVDPDDADSLLAASELRQMLEARSVRANLPAEERAQIWECYEEARAERLDAEEGVFSPTGALAY